ncbi:hypothetical protein [Pseudoalteromonas sp. T1lg23B]|uniref:hypothetical protein n=1 Tax=Pseudoalteromonas sp. T1lg23B TaxID=2077097 RepID=UPI000CF5EDFF|nr:hypothetical protein [Pseudoalteromonas sp. T1lg23B]
MTLLNKYNKKHLLIALLSLLLLIAASVQMGRLVFTPKAQGPIIAQSSYLACVNLLAIDESLVNEEKVKQLTLSCHNMLQRSSLFAKNSAGDYRVYIDNEQYYRIKPDLIERIRTRVDSILKSNPSWLEQPV